MIFDLSDDKLMDQSDAKIRVSERDDNHRIMDAVDSRQAGYRVKLGRDIGGRSYQKRLANDRHQTIVGSLRIGRVRILEKFL